MRPNRPQSRYYTAMMRLLTSAKPRNLPTPDQRRCLDISPQKLPGISRDRMSCGCKRGRSSTRRGLVRPRSNRRRATLPIKPTPAEIHAQAAPWVSEIGGGGTWTCAAARDEAGTGA
ncbi:hypothetical protein PVAP13_4KG000481 [Panicum virgatum]|uniref:Uncharacterized protein n=1 Tax=Panicum virgatum TaxID=38727 RepID=A0A8T0TBM2_PANVG|nr:hypothetical protein PVAP13_4KG000481 [Panicum virgatum]